MKRSEGINRRQVILGAGTMAAALGVPIPFERFLGSSIRPIALAQTSDSSEKKTGLTTLSDNPINVETPAHLLDERITSAGRMFVRNNGQVPNVSGVTDESWVLQIDGEVETPLELSIADLKSRFESVTLQLQLECGGNGRAFFAPGASGNQWTFGAIACPEWTGVRLRDLLRAAGLKESAVYTGHYGADPHLTGDPSKTALSRGVPIEKALDPHTIVAWAMNGESIPVLNGFPLRLIVPGWPGSCSQKWLNRIWVRDRVHDGAKMMGQSYRVPEYPIAPGTQVPDEDMKIIESMPVKSLITSPKSGLKQRPDTPFEVRGHAWAGDHAVNRVEVSIDFGQTWVDADLEAPVNKYAWQHWRAELSLPQLGYYEVWARATDETGRAQPPVAPNWNPRGYLNNMQHRIAVFAV